MKSLSLGRSVLSVGFLAFAAAVTGILVQSPLANAYSWVLRIVSALLLIAGLVVSTVAMWLGRSGRHASH